MLNLTMPRFGITTTFVDPRDPQAFAEAIRPETRLVFAETLGNPGIEVLDIAAVADVAHACGYRRVYSGTDLSLLDRLFTERDGGGPAFLHLRIERGASADLPRPTLSPPEVADRLRNWLTAPRSA
jgi:hypothetical protein